MTFYSQKLTALISIFQLNSDSNGPKINSLNKKEGKSLIRF